MCGELDLPLPSLQLVPQVVLTGQACGEAQDMRHTSVCLLELPARGNHPPLVGRGSTRRRMKTMEALLPVLCGVLVKKALYYPTPQTQHPLLRMVVQEQVQEQAQE
jgi:hypothetical protein